MFSVQCHMQACAGLVAGVDAAEMVLTVCSQGCGVQGVSSIVGVKSLEEGIKAHAEGADVLLLRREMLEEAERSQGVQVLLERLRDATSGDD